MQARGGRSPVKNAVQEKCHIESTEIEAFACLSSDDTRGYLIKVTAHVLYCQ